MIKFNSRIFLNASIKAAAAIGAFVLQIFLVKEMGPSQYGSFSIFLAYCSFLFIFSRLGFDVVSIRYGAIYKARGENDKIKSMLLAGLCASVFASILLTLLGGKAVQFFIGLFNLQTFDYESALYYLPALSSAAILLGTLRGCGAINTADFLDSIVRPLAVFIGVLSLSLYSATIDSKTLIVVYCSAILLISMLAFWAIAPHTSEFERKAAKLGLESQWFSSSFPLMLSALISFVFFQLDTLLLGLIHGNSEVAAYNMACNFTRIIIFVCLVVTAQSQPRLAVAFHERQFQKAKRIYKRSINTSLAFGVSALVFIIVAGERLLSYVDEQFVSAYLPLVLLSFAHIINIFIISSVSLLNMCGKDYSVVKAQLLGAITCFALDMLLIPEYGALGAAGSLLFALCLSAYLISKPVRQALRLQDAESKNAENEQQVIRTE